MIKGIIIILNNFIELQEIIVLHSIFYNTYTGSKEIKRNLDVSLNLRNYRLLSKHEIENESIYDQLKESDVWKNRSYKIKKKKEPKEHNVFSSMHFYCEKKIFDRFDEMENMINDKNINKSKYYWKVLKTFGSFCILPIVIGTSSIPFKEAKETNENITFSESNDYKHNLGITLNSKKFRLLSNNELEYVSIYDQLKGSNMWPKKTYKIIKKKKPNEKDIFKRIDFCFEKQVFDMFSEMDNKLNDKNVRQKKNFVLCKKLSLFIILPLFFVICSFLRKDLNLWNEVSMHKELMLNSLFIPAVIFLLLTAYILIKSVKYNILKKNKCRYIYTD
ncbi:hypothetical protein PVNG_04887 [Plasmodium vivax North Korean]|uniref:Variable surface protein n=1 Tax=Plasmodium vivax North Korean TaxID=1035514 RepID=A0A0J9U0T8_PLAVI|nr:hypothetical protein PVNG_04887 [Plasmodium vivax North Korean]